MVSKRKKTLLATLSSLFILMFGVQIVNAADTVQMRGPVVYCTQCRANYEIYKINNNKR